MGIELTNAVTNKQEMKTTEKPKAIQPAVINIESNSWSGKTKITYFNGEKIVEQTTRPDSVFAQMAKEFYNIKPNDSGEITKKQSLIMLQNVFSAPGYNSRDPQHMQNSNLSFLKDVIELYTDDESDGGKNITPSEQYAIMKTLDNNSWF